MSYFTAEVIGPKTWHILECGFCSIYYLEGEERGLLIDTGTGADDLRGFVATLATKPYDVVLTHAHLDHVGAIWQYDEIYLNKGDWEMALTTDDAARRHFIGNLNEQSEGRTPDHPTDKMLLRTETDPKLIDLTDGFVFHLGGRDVSVMTTAGHSEGSICLLDSQTRYLFVGDTIIYRLLLVNPRMSYLERVRQWWDNTRKIYDHLDDFAELYMGHCGIVPKHTRDDLNTIAAALLADITDIDDSDGFAKKAIGGTSIYLELPFEGPDNMK
ncbi:MBL fold metallo-hydrolase [Ruminococcaceae bacterium OttesenSCG-928-D13]|nr:MBL fold metallo-hydrolase [Ruminococcaceae bacterium OttesenSCG-928-D13]